MRVTDALPDLAGDAVRLPLVVIEEGDRLFAIDCVCEVLPFYTVKPRPYTFTV